jgi:hypothetical protein
MKNGDDLKREGAELVLANAGHKWRAAAANVLASMTGRFTAEDVRLACREKGIVPHHPNAWGAFIRYARNHNWIEPTGDWRKPRDPRSHSRPTEIYRR